MRDAKVFDTLILLALPASGKSEVRKFMRHGSDEQSVEQYHLGKTVQLDDFPYVHFMRVIDEALEELGHERRFYPDSEQGFLDGRDWGTLLKLVSQDYALITDTSASAPTADPKLLFQRIDQARKDVGAAEVFKDMNEGLINQLSDKLAAEAKRLVDELFSRRPANLDGHTVVIEFARGGPDGASCPLPEPHGYAYSLKQLSAEILESAAILYIWVSPEESRRKNIARADPNDPGSILHHSCPEVVMLNDYGTCDMGHLLETSDVEGTLRVEAHGRTFHIPTARFDNRVDKTSFIRDDETTWDASDVTAIEDGLSGALEQLWSKYTE